MVKNYIQTLPISHSDHNLFLGIPFTEVLIEEVSEATFQLRFSSLIPNIVDKDQSISFGKFFISDAAIVAEESWYIFTVTLVIKDKIDAIKLATISKDFGTEYHQKLISNSYYTC